MRTVLIVDDAATVRHMITDHLLALDSRVEIAESETASAGIEQFMADEYDLTFLDGFFSDGTPSVNVLQAMLAAKPRARIVVTSSRPREHPEVAESLGLGAYAYLAKPVRREAIEEIVQRVESDEGRVGRIR